MFSNGERFIIALIGLQSFAVLTVLGVYSNIQYNKGKEDAAREIKEQITIEAQELWEELKKTNKERA